jgi:hypothetical protein
MSLIMLFLEGSGVVGCYPVQQTFQNFVMPTKHRDYLPIGTALRPRRLECSVAFLLHAEICHLVRRLPCSVQEYP